jgi:hypothetical protein
LELGNSELGTLDLLYSFFNVAPFMMPRQSSIDLVSADRPFDNIINFRDVGRSVNHFCGAQYVCSHVIRCHSTPLQAGKLIQKQDLERGRAISQCKGKFTLNDRIRRRKNLKTDRDVYSWTMPLNEINAD